MVMRAGFIEKPEVAYFKETEEPQINNPTDVKIKVKVTGICGSEVQLTMENTLGCVPPLLSGHEFAGEVVKLAAPSRSLRLATVLPQSPSTVAVTVSSVRPVNIICARIRKYWALITGAAPSVSIL